MKTWNRHSRSDLRAWKFDEVTRSYSEDVTDSAAGYLLETLAACRESSDPRVRYLVAKYDILQDIRENVFMFEGEKEKDDDTTGE